MSRVTVLYLWRKVNDPRFACAFFNSMRQHSAGADYNFVFAAKGYGSDEAVINLDSLAMTSAASTSIMRFPDTQTPIAIYRAVSEICDTEFILVFNSWSRVLHANWLVHYVEAFDTITDCGLVGATGSYEATEGQDFPNYSIRTNAFMIPTALFNGLDTGNLGTIEDDHRFEAGQLNMTRQVVDRGLQAVVVDHIGGKWLRDQWYQSKTFRAHEQEGLLIADNRTNQYASGSRRKRSRLASRAWGPLACPPDKSHLQRAACWYRWNYPRGVGDLLGDGLWEVARIFRKVMHLSPMQRKKVFPS